MKDDVCDCLDMIDIIESRPIDIKKRIKMECVYIL